MGWILLKWADCLANTTNSIVCLHGKGWSNLLLWWIVYGVSVTASVDLVTVLLKSQICGDHGIGMIALVVFLTIWRLLILSIVVIPQVQELREPCKLRWRTSISTTRSIRVCPSHHADRGTLSPVDTARMLGSVAIHLLQIGLTVFVSLQQVQVLRLPERIVIQAPIVRLLLSESFGWWDTLLGCYWFNKGPVQIEFPHFLGRLLTRRNRLSCCRIRRFITAILLIFRRRVKPYEPLSGIFLYLKVFLGCIGDLIKVDLFDLWCLSWNRSLKGCECGMMQMSNSIWSSFRAYCH